MKNEDIKQLSTEEIVERIQEEKTNYSKLKFSHTVSAVDNPVKLRAMRKAVARLSTELRSREMAEQIESKK
ncbi:MAG: large subunit ribosomal protein L29 [Sphingobacteriales bacterium]|jgi:large subunit ribosomal protein L29